MRTEEAINAYLNPIKANDFERRRRKLDLSRPALARIFGVDEATVFRYERERPYDPLWDYALRGVEHEAADKHSKTVLRLYAADVKHQIEQQSFIPDQIEARGRGLLAEKMRQTWRGRKPQQRSGGKKKHQVVDVVEAEAPSRRAPTLTAREIKRIADAAEKGRKNS